MVGYSTHGMVGCGSQGKVIFGSHCMVSTYVIIGCGTHGWLQRTGYGANIVRLDVAHMVW